MRFRKLLLVVGAALWVSFCSSNKHAIKDVPVSESIADNPVEKINELDAEVNKARNNQVNLLAPTWFQSAEDSLKKAKDKQKDGKDLYEVFSHINEGKIQIDRANQFAEVARKRMSDVLSERDKTLAVYQKAQEGGASKLTPVASDLESTDKDLRDVAAAIETNSTGEFTSERGDLIRKYRDIRVEAVKKERLHLAQRIVDQAKKEGAARYAPKALKTSEDLNSSLEKFIVNNTYDSEKISQKSDEAINYATRLLYFTRQGKRIAEATPEDNLMWVEQQLNTIMAELKQKGDPSDKIEQKVQTIVSQLRKNQNIVNRSEPLAATPQPSPQTIIVQNQWPSPSPEEERKANFLPEDLSKVQAMFTSSEAEVVGTNSEVLIGLKKITFDKRIQTPSNRHFPLFAKVAKVISLFPDSTVWVQGPVTSKKGRTGDIGYRKAQAVRNYLVSHFDVKDSQVHAISDSDEDKGRESALVSGSRIRNSDILVTVTTRSSFSQR